MHNVDFSDIGRSLERLGIVRGPSEYHGTLCGELCMDGLSGGLPLMDEVEGDLSQHESEARQLKALQQQSLAALLDAQMGFEPLLPDDEQPLETRIEALAEWCQGFLWGVATRRRLDMDALSEEAREIVQDMLEISRVGIDTDSEDAEAEEVAYTEIVEYIRVGVQMIFLDLYPGMERERVDRQTH